MQDETARLDAAAAAICERRNAQDWPCNGLDFDMEMARVALEAADRTSGNTLPLEQLPPGCVASIYAPLDRVPGIWSSCIHRGSKAYRLGYGGSPRDAVLSAIAQVRDD